MSGQPNQRVRRIASPSTKQGPMKATLTFGLMQGSPTRTGNARKNSPSSSPTQQWSTDGHRVKAWRSPDNRASPERASPSSPVFKGMHWNRAHFDHASVRHFRCRFHQESSQNKIKRKKSKFSQKIKNAERPHLKKFIIFNPM